MPFGPIERGARDIDGHLICVRGEKIGACLLGHGFKLRNRGGPVDIDRYRQDLLFCSRSRLASLPTVVVLPAPCKPAIRMIAGGATVSRSSDARPSSAPPITAASSRCTR